MAFYQLGTIKYFPDKGFHVTVSTTDTSSVLPGRRILQFVPNEIEGRDVVVRKCDDAWLHIWYQSPRVHTLPVT